MTGFELFGELVRVVRRRKGESVLETAAALGVVPAVVSRWQNGRDLPRMKAFERLARHFGLHLGDVDDLLADLAGEPRTPRPGALPRNEAEVDAFLDALLGSPEPGEDAEALAQVRAVLRANLLLAAHLKGNGRLGRAAKPGPETERRRLRAAGGKGE